MIDVLYFAWLRERADLQIVLQNRAVDVRAKYALIDLLFCRLEGRFGEHQFRLRHGQLLGTLLLDASSFLHPLPSQSQSVTSDGKNPCLRVVTGAVLDRQEAHSSLA